MNWVLEFVNNIPVILTYVVPGYLFLAIYRYMLFKDENASDRTASLLLNSIITSLVLKALYDVAASMLHQSQASGTYLAGIILWGVLAGFVSAKFVETSVMDWLLGFLNINRTVHSNIWDDALAEGQWIRIWLPNSERSYYGMVAAAENYNREPIILLRNYQFLDDDGTTLIDNVADTRRTVLLNLSGFERVEIVEAEDCE